MSPTPRTTAPEALPPRDEHTGRSVIAVVGFLAFIELCSGVLQGSVPSLTPLIGAAFKVSSGDLTWVNSLPLLISGISVPLLAKLGDRYGHRRLIRITMVIVAAGSIIVATAGSFTLLLIGRALQGVFSAWLPLEFAIVRDRVEPKRSGAAIGLLVGALAVGATLGSLGVGLLAKQVSGVHAPLWLPAGCILACLPIVFLLIPESTSRSRGHIDWLGAGLLSLGLGAALLALGQGGAWGWSSAQVISLLIGTIVLLAGFAAAELRVREPLVDLRAIAGRSMAPLYVLSFVLGATLFGAETAGATFSATPRMFGFGFGLDTLGLALTGLPTSMAMLIAATFADRVARALSPRVTLIGAFGLVALGYVSMAAFHVQLWQTITANTVIGLGTGLTLGALPTVIMAGLPADQTGIGMGLYNTLKALAGSVVSAVFAVVMNRNLLKIQIPGVKLSDQHAYVLVWSACAAIALLGILVATALRACAATWAEDDVPAVATTSA